MDNLGNRVIFDVLTGYIYFQTGEMQGDVLDHPTIHELSYIDLPYGYIDYKKNYIKSIDVVSGMPIIEAYPVEETEDQKRIKQLEEDILLLQADSTIGGIL